jgi:Amt family ammonium transporter
VVVVTVVFVAIGTALIYKVVDLLVGMRVDKKEEDIGLDLSQHHETGYTLIE